jgi:hypothetical protein
MAALKSHATHGHEIAQSPRSPLEGLEEEGWCVDSRGCLIRFDCPSVDGQPYVWVENNIGAGRSYRPDKILHGEGSGSESYAHDMARMLCARRVTSCKILLPRYHAMLTFFALISAYSLKLRCYHLAHFRSGAATSSRLTNEETEAM